jgi:hypothetical protein
VCMDQILCIFIRLLWMVLPYKPCIQRLLSPAAYPSLSVHIINYHDCLLNDGDHVRGYPPETDYQNSGHKKPSFAEKQRQRLNSSYDVACFWRCGRDFTIGLHRQKREEKRDHYALFKEIRTVTRLMLISTTLVT